MAGNIIRRFVIKQLSKDRGSGIMEIPNRYAVDQKQLSLQNYLLKKGVNPDSIQSEGQLTNILQQIEKNRIATNLKKAEAQKKMAEIMDLKGRKIKNPQNIMGGREVGMFDNIFARMKKDMDGGKFKTVKKKETEKEIAERIKKENKKAVDKIKKDKDFDFDQDPEFASGGRAGLSYLLAEDTNERTNFAAGGVDRLRRLFLKMLGAGAATTAAVKSGILSFGGRKSAAKKVAKQIIKTDNVAGKPEWFDALVTRVINEGDEVTKKFATKERQTVHKKKITEDDTVTVTQDLDEGSITVDYDSPKNTFEDTVTLKYKKPNPDEGDPRPTAEFEVAESGPVGRQQSPDDYDIEIDEVGGTSIKDLDSDVSTLKEFATNKKPTMKEIVQNKKRKDKAKNITEDSEAQMDAIINRQGEMLDYDDYAEGGRAKMYLGGGLLKGKRFLKELTKNLAKEKDIKPSFLMRIQNPKSYKKALEDAEGSGMYDRKTGILRSEKIKNIIDDVKKSRVEQLERYKDMAESQMSKQKNINDMIKAAKEIGATDEIAESMAKSLDQMFPDGVIPKNVTDETILELEQMLKNETMRNTNRLTNANGGIARLLGE
jgi:hypothetical protein